MKNKGTGYFPFVMRVKLVDAPRFGYRGGKALLRRYIVRWIVSEGDYYIEPFAGRGNMFFIVKCFAKFNNWVLNDIQTTPFFNAVLKYDGSELPVIKNKEEMIDLYNKNIDLYRIMEPILSWAGAWCDDKRISYANKVSGMRMKTLDLYRENLLKAKKLLKGVQIIKIDAIQLINKYINNTDIFMYLDPPYMGAKVSGYNEDMLDRKLFIELLKKAKFKWLLSEYYCNDLVKEFGEPLTKIKNIPINPSSKSIAVKRVEECLWSNYKTKPIILNFGNSRYHAGSMKESLEIFDNCISLSFNTFSNLVPQQWINSTRHIQFNRLLTLPHAYYDGKTLFNLNNWED